MQSRLTEVLDPLPHAGEITVSRLLDIREGEAAYAEGTRNRRRLAHDLERLLDVRERHTDPHLASGWRQAAVAAARVRRMRDTQERRACAVPRAAYVVRDHAERDDVVGRRQRLRIGVGQLVSFRHLGGDVIQHHSIHL